MLDVFYVNEDIDRLGPGDRVAGFNQQNSIGETVWKRIRDNCFGGERGKHRSRSSDRLDISESLLFSLFSHGTKYFGHLGEQILVVSAIPGFIKIELIEELGFTN